MAFWDNFNFRILERISSAFAANTAYDYLIALIAFAVILGIFKGFKFFLLKRLRRFAEKTSTDYDLLAVDIVETFGWPLYFSVALYLASLMLVVPQTVSRIIIYIILVYLIFYGVKACFAVVDFFVNKEVEKRKKKEIVEGTSFLKLLGNIVKGIVLIIAVLLVVSNLGFDVTSLFVGIGIGGIAIAFALQNILADLFSSFSIYFDKPFEEGDFIIVGSDMGIVKRIGFKSTRIKTLHGQELVVSNKELTSTRINNYKKMQRRRIVFNVGVEYSTPRKKLEKIPAIIRKIIDDIELADIDRVHFKEFADSSLNFEVVYYVDIADYNKYMDIQQEINLNLVSAFEKENIAFAFPSRTVYLRKD